MRRPPRSALVPYTTLFRSQDGLQVADAHVVADDGQVVASQLALREREVARGGAQGRDGVEALVDSAAPGLQPPHDGVAPAGLDRKSTRLNSSHANISYAVF